MAVNPTGPPSQATAGAHFASVAFLAAHVLIALGLVTGTVLLLRAATRAGGQWRRQAIGGTAATGVTVATGILTLLTHQRLAVIRQASRFYRRAPDLRNLLIQPEHRRSR